MAGIEIAQNQQILNLLRQGSSTVAKRGVDIEVQDGIKAFEDVAILLNNGKAKRALDIPNNNQHMETALNGTNGNTGYITSVCRAKDGFLYVDSGNTPIVGYCKVNVDNSLSFTTNADVTDTGDYSYIAYDEATGYFVTLTDTDKLDAYKLNTDDTITYIGRVTLTDGKTKYNGITIVLNNGIGAVCFGYSIDLYLAPFKITDTEITTNDYQIVDNLDDSFDYIPVSFYENGKFYLINNNNGFIELTINDDLTFSINQQIVDVRLGYTYGLFFNTDDYFYNVKFDNSSLKATIIYQNIIDKNDNGSNEIDFQYLLTAYNVDSNYRDTIVNGFDLVWKISINTFIISLNNRYQAKLFEITLNSPTDVTIKPLTNFFQNWTTNSYGDANSSYSNRGTLINKIDNKYVLFNFNNGVDLPTFVCNIIEINEENNYTLIDGFVTQDAADGEFVKFYTDKEVYETTLSVGTITPNGFVATSTNKLLPTK